MKKNNRMFNECYCNTCEKSIKYLGIARHRAMHRDKKEDCSITFTDGNTYFWKYSEQKNKSYQTTDEAIAKELAKRQAE